MNIEDLNGKTIRAAYQMKMEKCDDDGFLRLEFTDGTRCDVIAGYGGYTGMSKDEHPTDISVDECDDSLIRCENAEANDDAYNAT